MQTSQHNVESQRARRGGTNKRIWWHVKIGLTDLRDSRRVPIVLIEAFIVLL